MNRKETLQQEYEARVAKTRLESALPSRMPRRRSYAGLVWLALLLLAAAGVAGWYFYGRTLP